ncbi:hypothetical protein EHQ53_06090 [Leptospira langatensis]|uniref:DUF3108 domain-containing protein n=1 Tax=Leptospira langatensis TaxID=2484983 RepID=A0A5F1ZU25_9LEPT|nr:hypothetical protein [Leptospira langatensis]TGK03026.1 hypothetical protein EHO57_06925 [Leptospira langatensis]TGL41782.1 hypothetical protein EHQ53_06090 [Leptospira langatensis]
MFRKILFISLFTILLSAYPNYLQGTGAKQIRFIGTAYDLETGKLLYRDYHEEYWENGKHTHSLVTYKDPEGRIFAKKRISFAKNRNIPDFQLDDDRDGYLEGGSFLGGNSVKLYARRKTSDPLQEKVLENNGPSALDGGFDYFVEDHWEELRSGKKLSLYFLVPVERDKFRFTVEKTKEGEFNGKSSLFLRLRIDSAFLSVFVKPIDLVYDMGSKRIMEYKGTSNINDENGKSHQVRIVYGMR